MNQYIKSLMRSKTAAHCLRGFAFAMAVTLGVVGAMALPVEYYAASSTLAKDGHWVKVKVTNTGIHRITADQLRQWGFSNPEAVHVFGYSAVELAEDRLSTDQPDDLPQLYSRYIEDGLYFYAENDYRVKLLGSNSSQVDRNYYATYSVYFLSDIPVSGISEVKIKYDERASSLTTHRAFDYVEPEEYNAVNAGTFFFSNPLARNPESGVITFHPKDQTGLGVLEYRNVAYSTVDIKPLPTLTSGLQFTMSNVGTMVNPIKGLYDPDDFSISRYCNLPAPTCLPVLLQSGTVAHTVTFADPGLSDCQYFGLDYACLYYDRQNRVGNNGQLQIQVPLFDEGFNMTLTECTAHTQVWEVSDPLNVMVYDVDFDDVDKTVSIAPPGGYVRMVAFEPGASDGLCDVTYMGEVENVANLHAQREPVDLVIIAPTGLLESANDLAELHRQYQGLDVRVVDAQDVYNEFSSGTPSATAYRRYVKFLKDLPGQKLENLLLFGHGTFDNRGIMQVIENNLMTFQARENRDNPDGIFRSSIQCYGADSYFGMLNEEMQVEKLPGNKMDIGVGRVPAKDLSQAKSYVNKVKEYFEDHNNDTYFSRATLVSDYGNANNHMILSEQAASIIEGAQYAPVMTKLYSSLYERNADIFHPLLSANFAQGTYYWSYSGHASTSTLVSNSVITNKTVNEYPYGNHAVVMLATCSGLLLDTQDASIGRTMITTDHGPVAVVGACRSVYLHLNAFIYRAFTRYMMRNTPNQTLGGIYRNAYNEVTSDDLSLNLNTLCYNFGGDPALPVPYISRTATVLTVDGETAGTSMMRTSLTPITLTGEIRDESGSIDAEFNGIVTVDLYNGAETRASMEYGTGSGMDESMDIAMHEGLIASFRTPVREGKWTVTVTSPMPSRGGTPTLMVMGAVDATRQIRALGRFEDITLADPADDYVAADVTGPKISTLYLDSEDFNDGDCVSHQPTLYAKVDPDESGISIMANPMGQAPSVSIDGKMSYSNAAGLLKPQPDGSATMTLPLSNLADGAHTVQLTVFDNVGNFTRRTIGFTVVNSGLQGTLAVDNSFPIDNLTLDVGMPTTGTRATRLIIEDVEGNTVKTVENPSFPYLLNVKEMPEGYYRALVFLQSSLGYGRTPLVGFTVLKP